MTVRTRTTRWAWDTNTASLASNTQYVFGAITVRAPTASRTILSAIIKYTFYFDSATAANLTNRAGGVQIDAVGGTDIADTGTLANTADHSAWCGTTDVTSYFVTNFTGASHSVQARWKQIGPPAINLTAELFLTYQYDDAGLTTDYKTIVFGLDSPTDRLTSTLTEIGTNQVPVLFSSTLAAEASPTLRDFYFVYEGNLGADAVTNFQLGLSLDAEAEALQGSYQQALITGVFVQGIWRRADINPAATHQFKARTTVTSRMEHLAVQCVATYEYNPSTTTRTCNSIQVPMPMPESVTASSTANEATRQSVEVWIEEPGTITLAQSAILCRYVHVGLPTGFNVRAGAQSFRNYVKSAITDCTGGFALTQRIDSGGAQGAGATLARGLNTITFDSYRTGGTTNGLAPTALSATLLLNYVSDVATGGIGAHNATRYYSFGDNVAAALVDSDATFAATIPEASYWLNSFGIESYIWTSVDCYFSAKVSRGAGLGWSTIMSAGANAGDANTIIMVCGANDVFKRNPNDPVTGRLDIETSRTARMSYFGSTIFWPATLALVTYHAITFTDAGTVSTDTGDGSGLTVDIHRSDTDEKISSATTSVGGGFTAVSYDNTITHYAQCQQSDTRVGRSKDEVSQ